jgi:hypothetical protein
MSGLRSSDSTNAQCIDITDGLGWMLDMSIHATDSAHTPGVARDRNESFRLVCAILMFCAGLLLRTVINLRAQDLGYQRDVLPIPIAAERPGRPPEAAAALVARLRQQIAAIPACRRPAALVRRSSQPRF